MAEEIDISSELAQSEATEVSLAKIDAFVHDEDVDISVRYLAEDVHLKMTALEGKLKSIEKKCERDANFYVMTFVFRYDSKMTSVYLSETFKSLFPKLTISTTNELVEGFKGTTQLSLTVRLPPNEKKSEVPFRSDKTIVLPVLSSSIIMDEEDKRTISKVNDMISMTGGVLKSFARFDEGTGFAYELKFGWNEGWAVDRKEIVDRVIRLPGVKTMTPLDIRGSYDPFTNKTNGIMTVAISNKAKRYVSDDIMFKKSSSTPLMDEMEKTIELMNKRKREEEGEEKSESNSTETRKAKRRKKTRETNGEAEEPKSKDDEPIKRIKPETVEIHTVDGKVYEVPFQIINSNCFLFKECATYGEWETKGVPKEGFFMGILSKNFERLYTTIRYSVFPDDNFFMSDQEKRELEDDCAFYGVEYKKAPRARFNPIPENARDTTKGPVYFCVRCDYVVNDPSELGSICLECSNRPSAPGHSGLDRLFMGASPQVTRFERCSCIKQVKVCHSCAKLLQCAIQKRWIADVEFVLSKMPQSQ